MTEVKICGLRTPEMIHAAADAGADWIGLVLFPRSPRNILGEGAAAFDTLKKLGAEVRAAGLRSAALLVDPDDTLVSHIAATGAVDALQLQGDESPERVSEIAGLAGVHCEIWRALPVTGPEAFDRLDDWPVSRFLFDAPAPGSELPGGNGEVFDWALMAGLATDRPWFLAGGLTPDNVADAVTQTGAPGVDVSTGVERARGVKDEARVRAFIAAAKSA